MIDVRELNARGVQTRVAMDILRGTIKDPQMALAVAYAYATFSNLMVQLEQAYGVFPGYFGSAGVLLREIDPFSGQAMPAPVSLEPPPTFAPPGELPAP